MTKLITVFFGLCIILSLGCSNDEEDFLTPLVGSWQTSVITSSGCTDPNDNGTLTCTGAPCFDITINSNGTYTLVDNVDVTTESGTITVTATTLTICATGDTNCTPDTYTLAGDTLTVSFTDDASPGCTFTAAFTKQ